MLREEDYHKYQVCFLVTWKKTGSKPGSILTLPRQYLPFIHAMHKQKYKRTISLLKTMNRFLLGLGLNEKDTAFKKVSVSLAGLVKL